MFHMFWMNAMDSVGVKTIELIAAVGVIVPSSFCDGGAPRAV